MDVGKRLEADVFWLFSPARSLKRRFWVVNIRYFVEAVWNGLEALSNIVKWLFIFVVAISWAASSLGVVGSLE
jgi:hypothetical protein